MTKENNVAIIGGLGRMGLVTKKVFQEAGYAPIISDIKDPTTLSPREAINRSQIVFFSVLPIESVGDIIKATADAFDNTHCVLDNASLKDPLREGYDLLNGKQVSICSTHPLCKDDQPFFGQNVFIAPFGKNPQEATLIAEEVYKKAGMVLIRVDFDKHDSLSVINQLLPHLLHRAAGIALTKNSIDINAVDTIATANFQLYELSLWRTLVQDPKISATIIKNLLRQPEGLKIAKDLQKAIERIIKESENPNQLEQTFEDAVNLLDPTGKIRLVMNDKTITILERLANLKLHSVTVESKEDKPGLLLTMLQELYECKINLNAIDSKKTGEGVRFDLGIESGTMTPEVIEKLKELGFHVISLTVS